MVSLYVISRGRGGWPVGGPVGGGVGYQAGLECREPRLSRLPTVEAVIGPLPPDDALSRLVPDLRERCVWIPTG